jgi:hypothetical protein
MRKSDSTRVIEALEAIHATPEQRNHAAILFFFDGIGAALLYLETIATTHVIRDLVEPVAFVTCECELTF